MAVEHLVAQWGSGAPLGGVDARTVVHRQLGVEALHRGRRRGEGVTGDGRDGCSQIGFGTELIAGDAHRGVVHPPQVDPELQCCAQYPR